MRRDPDGRTLEAIGMIAGGVAHELHHLVTLLLASDRSPGPELPAGVPRRADSRSLLASAQRAAVLTRQLLAISRHRSLAPRIVNLNDLVARDEPAWRALLGSAIALDLSLDPDLDQVKVDPAQFGKALLCLVENARDAMPRGGRLAVTTCRARFEAAAVRPGDPPPGAYAVVAVADSGCGMAPEVLDRIFDPFFTTKEGAGRTGLGLSAVHAIVAQSGGHLRVESRPEEGSTFRILLPHLASGH